MPLFTLWRTLDHTLGESERENITIRSIGACEWFPGVRWQRSFVIDEPGRLQSLCVYEGPTLEAVRDQSTLCVVPFTEIREVTELIAKEAGGAGPLGSEGLYMVDRHFLKQSEPAEIEAAIKRAPMSDGVTWLRSYLDPGGGTTRCITRADSETDVRAHALRAGLPCESIERVVENHPAHWADVYDGFGLPRHWEIESVVRGPQSGRVPA